MEKEEGNEFGWDWTTQVGHRLATKRSERSMFVLSFYGSFRRQLNKRNKVENLPHMHEHDSLLQPHPCNSVPTNNMNPSKKRCYITSLIRISLPQQNTVPFHHRVDPLFPYFHVHSLRSKYARGFIWFVCDVQNHEFHEFYKRS